jgi:hypothetical protein
MYNDMSAQVRELEKADQLAWQKKKSLREV